MIVAISQPEHFPYLGFFQKVAACDLFVLLDCVQFQGKGSFQARNWLLNTQDQREWFTLHLPRGTKHLRIDEVPLLEGQQWRKRYCRKLRYNAGFDAEALLEHRMLVDVNVASIELICRRLGITTPLIRSSTLSIEGHKSERVAAICRELGATTYLSGPGALGYLDATVFGEIGIEVFEPAVPDYQSALAHLSWP